MNWSEHKAIYFQIADAMMDEVLSKAVSPGQRVLSVREKAAQIEVNPNTVARAYSLLEAEGIIHNQRGLGFFYAEEALPRARAFKKEVFSRELLPQVFHTIDLLDMSPEELIAAYRAYKGQSA